MKIKMELLSDAIFGCGLRVPGEENLSVLRDEFGFPYYKGGTFKGIFRETMERYVDWNKEAKLAETDARGLRNLDKLLGKKGTDIEPGNQLIFTNFELSSGVREIIQKEMLSPAEVLNLFSHMRMFTAIDEKNGIAKNGTLRMYRCINKGLVFYGEIVFPEKITVEEREEVQEVLELVKAVGLLHNRGFGEVRISVVEEEK